MLQSITPAAHNTDRDLVVLVDAQDRANGTMDKLEAHRRGLKHRAVSALVRNGRGELLLQRRAHGKYHSAGQWANACCSHPRPDERASAAVHRRLTEEMGLRCELQPLFTTNYRAVVSNDLVEDEFVHVFGGQHDGAVAPNAAEVAEWKWIAMADLRADADSHPDNYAPWFRHYIRNHGDEIARWLRDPVTQV